MAGLDRPPLDQRRGRGRAQVRQGLDQDREPLPLRNKDYPVWLFGDEFQLCGLAHDVAGREGHVVLPGGGRPGQGRQERVDGLHLRPGVLQQPVGLLLHQPAIGLPVVGQPFAQGPPPRPGRVGGGAWGKQPQRRQFRAEVAGVVQDAAAPVQRQRRFIDLRRFDPRVVQELVQMAAQHVTQVLEAKHVRCCQHSGSPGLRPRSSRPPFIVTSIRREVKGITKSSRWEFGGGRNGSPPTRVQGEEMIPPFPGFGGKK
jgi:hypothetical protein